MISTNLGGQVIRALNLPINCTQIRITFEPASPLTVECSYFPARLGEGDIKPVEQTLVRRESTSAEKLICNDPELANIILEALGIPKELKFLQRINVTMSMQQPDQVSIDFLLQDLPHRKSTFANMLSLVPMVNVEPTKDENA